MPISLSGAAALGAAKLATRAVSESIQGSVGVISSFAEALGEKLSDPATETAVPTTEKLLDNAVDTDRAKSSLRELFSGWMRHFGLSGNEPIEVRLEPNSNSVQIESASGSPEISRAISDLQTRINADDSLRDNIADSLQHLPDRCFTMSHSWVDR